MLVLPCRILAASAVAPLDAAFALAAVRPASAAHYSAFRPCRSLSARRTKENACTIADASIVWFGHEPPFVYQNSSE